MTFQDTERVEELCEEIWSLAEDGVKSRARVVQGSKIENPESTLGLLVGEGLARVAGDQVELTEAGSELARGIVRRHRLAEILFSDLLRLEETVSESTACAVEHILPPAVADSICTYLGHPTRCPHGKPIPPGQCCGVYEGKGAAEVVRLKDVPVGASGRIVFITTSAQDRLARLAALGIVPGRDVRLVQRTPSVVFEAGQTTVAVDPEIAEQIVVQITP